MKNFKESFLGMKSKMAVAVGSAIAIVSTAVPCFAADSTVATMMGTALGTVKTDFDATVAVVAPIGIGITAVFLIWKLGMKFFKSITGK